MKILHKIVYWLFYLMGLLMLGVGVFGIGLGIKAWGLMTVKEIISTFMISISLLVMGYFVQKGAWEDMWDKSFWDIFDHNDGGKR